jgi:predicted dehydrogenase
VLNLGLVGAGIMGSSHARVARLLADARITVVVDPDPARGGLLADHIGATYASSPEALHGRVDAAIVAAPTEAHASIAVMLLEREIDVLVEKPIAVSVAEAMDVVAAAEKHERILMVGHIERFNPAVMELSRHLNGLLHLDIRRVGPFTPRVTTGVVLDLMIHDVDLANRLTGSRPKEISAVTQRVRSATEDIAACLLIFENGMTAALTASRVSQAKQRQIELTQRDNVIVADLLRQQVTLHRVEHAEYLDDQGTRYQQSGMVEIPYLENNGEPLALEQHHFVECVITRAKPAVTGWDGLAALETAIRIRDEAVCARLTDVAGVTDV